MVVEFHNEKIENKQKQVAEEHGFTIKEHQIVLYGVCNAELCNTL